MQSAQAHTVRSGKGHFFSRSVRADLAFSAPILPTKTQPTETRVNSLRNRAAPGFPQLGLQDHALSVPASVSPVILNRDRRICTQR